MMRQQLLTLMTPSKLILSRSFKQNLTFSADLWGDVITFVVGQKCKVFVIHKQEIASKSSFLKAQIEGLGKKEVVYFANYNADYFSEVVNWLYKGKAQCLEQKYELSADA